MGLKYADGRQLRTTGLEEMQSCMNLQTAVWRSLPSLLPPLLTHTL